MVRKLTANISEELEDVDISEFSGEGPAGAKAEWETASELEEVVEAVNSDDVFPTYNLKDVLNGSAEQVGLYNGDSFTEYSFNSSEYHLRARVHDIGWKKTELEFISLSEGDYRDDVAFYFEEI